MKGIDLYKGDCLEVMDEMISKQVQVDCIITDPPYGMSYKSTLEKHRPIINDDNLNWLEPFAEKAFKILKDIRLSVTFECSFALINIYNHFILRTVVSKEVV